MSSAFTESGVEEAALAWLESVGSQVRNGAQIAPGEAATERDDYAKVVLTQRLRDALARLNPALPAAAMDDVFRKLTRLGFDTVGADLIARNRALHRLLADGVTVEYRDAEGSIRGAQARVIGFDDPVGNDWLAVNQFSVVEHKHSRLPDVMLFGNGLPLAVLELKNAAAENATIWSAFQQLQIYQAEIPTLFAPNALLAVSDGVEARVGRLGAGREWFKPWRTVAGDTLAKAHVSGLQEARR
jgi:type I restriction enzyme R subunit